MKRVLRPRCVLCQMYEAQDPYPLCDGCRADLAWRGETLAVQDLSIQIAFAYQWPIDRLIHLYKYQARLELVPVFQYGLMQLQRPEVDALLAVPLSPSRLRERGFNQSHELAKKMAYYWNIPLLTGVNRRDGLRQKGLGRGERLQNLDNAFSFEPSDKKVLPRRIALIDDVLTTGGTLLSLAAFLRAKGVEELTGIVVASQHQHDSNK
ncbi:MAG: ComF family protein [Candidatus Saccharibacteria bacterium]|nr:ComF family protein [Moraxellaceae bacterium]